MSRPAPVLLLARELGQGGSERQMTAIARALDRSRFTPFAGAFRAEGIRADELRAAGVPVVEFPVRSLYAPSTLAVARRFGRFIAAQRIAIVHSFDVPGNVFAAPLARWFRAPVVLTSQRAYRDLTPGMPRHLLRLTDQIADGIVVNCQAMHRHLVEDERVPAARVHLCYNGLDTHMFTPAARAGPAALPVIGTVCALRPEKGLDTLVEAFATVAGRARLLLVGSGPEQPRLEARTRDLGIGDACHFEPTTRSVADWLRRIDIFVLPSRSEALSNALMEAMACGCAAVASDVGGNPELVEHERTGLLFRAGDAPALAGHLRRLLDNAGLRRSTADAGARRIREQLSL
ncbi:MAG: glycosyltransferase, partial [Bryobacteraceae bacterium]